MGCVYGKGLEDWRLTSLAPTEIPPQLETSTETFLKKSLRAHFRSQLVK